jgi:hypothetical protein
MYEKQHESSALTFDQFTYTRAMGAYKPAFSGIPDDFYPLTGCEVVKYALFVLGIIGGVLGIMIGFLFWIIKGGLDGYIVAWSVTTLAFVLIMIILFYVGGKTRIK